MIFVICKQKTKKKFATYRFYPYLCSAFEENGALAHLARAFDWQSRGGEFESRMLHTNKKQPADIQRVSSLMEIFIYLIAVNVVAFFMYGIDKWRAKRSKWRISEATLLLLAVIGGSIGAWLGMKVWHHKTLHKKFRFGIPAIIIIQLFIICYHRFVSLM